MKTASLVKSLVLAWLIAVCAATAQAGEYAIASAAQASLKKVISRAYSSPYFPHYGVGGGAVEYYTLEDTEMMKVNESVAAIFWAIETYASALASCSPGGPASMTGSGLKSRLLALAHSARKNREAIEKMIKSGWPYDYLKFSDSALTPGEAFARWGIWLKPFDDALSESQRTLRNLEKEISDELSNLALIR